MTTTRQDVYPPRSHGSLPSDHEVSDGDEARRAAAPKKTAARASDAAAALAAIPPVRKAAIVLVSLDAVAGARSCCRTLTDRRSRR